MTSSPAGTNPYVGLRPFEREDSLYFFGRREQTAELLERLHQNRFLAVVGSSGCGKSSLIRASLIPALLGGFLVDQRDEWMIALLKPGDSPMRNLAAALCAAASGACRAEDIDSLEKEIVGDQADAVVRYLAPTLGDNANLLLLVDQFEEIFSFRGTEDEEQLARLSPSMMRERGARRAEAANFVDLMLSLPVVAELPVCVVLTMRSDFLGDCELFYGLPEAMNRSRYLVPRLTRPQLREAVQGPALLSGVAIAPRLLDTVLNDLGGRSDQLPVLQHALFRTWNAWHLEPSGPLDLKHYEDIGGLKDALSKHATEALRADDLAVTATIFKCLTDTDPNQRRIRRPAHVRELAEVSGTNEAAIDTIVERFRADGRNFLVVSGSREGDSRVDISHESLIRQWAQLRSWIDEERTSRDHYLDLVKSARAGRALLQEPDLQLALKWRDSANPTPAWASRYSERDEDFAAAMGYLARSRAAAVDAWRQKKRFQSSLRAAVAMVMVLLAGLVIWAFVEKFQADRAEIRAASAEKVAALTRNEAFQYAAKLEQVNSESQTRVQEAEQLLRSVQQTAALPTRTPVPRPAPPPAVPKSPAVTVPTPRTLSPMDGRLITYSNVSLNGQGNSIWVSPGERFTISFLWEGRVDRKEISCPGCIVQLYYGIDHQAGGASKCFVSDIMGADWHGKGQVKGILLAPQAKGTYFVTQSTTLDYSCVETKVKQTNDPKDAIAAVTVQ